MNQTEQKERSTWKQKIMLQFVSYYIECCLAHFDNATSYESTRHTMESKHAYMMHVFTSQRMARQEPAAL